MKVIVNSVKLVTMLSFAHKPVLLKESIEALGVRAGGQYIDCTIGSGGHAQAILERGGRVLGIDADPQAIAAARERLGGHLENLVLVQGNFRDLKDICRRFSLGPIDGILFDLGVSTLQLEDRERGFSFQQDSPLDMRFSFQQDSPLDMRFSPDQELTAADIVNNFPEEALAGILHRYGEERRARQIARRIVANRPIGSTSELVQVVRQVLRKRHKIHVATRTFQALRIAVNKELENLELALKQVADVLGFGGRIVVISFHSLEDRLVKSFFGRESRGCLCPPGLPVCVCSHVPTLKLLTKKVIRPSLAEVRTNPRSRSARLRAAECIAPGWKLPEGTDIISCGAMERRGKCQELSPL